MTDRTHKPPMHKSDEADPEQLQFARVQGGTYQEALEHMANEEADDGGETRGGDYIVAYAVEKAEGMYALKDGELKWQEPGDANAHIEISVRDASDNRFIPHLEITVAVYDSQGERVGEHTQPFIWHPWLYHYGRNWKLPGDGEYTLHVHIKAPTFMRHDRLNGKRYAEDVDVTFEEVNISTGRK
jgi:hypothetical protein